MTFLSASFFMFLITLYIYLCRLPNFVAYLLENDFKVSRHNLKIVSDKWIKDLKNLYCAKLPKEITPNHRKI